MLGGVLSTTVTVKEQVALLPPASVVIHDTVLLPKGKAEPLGKPLRSVVVVVQLSVTVTM